MTGRVFLIGRFQLLVQYKNERTAFWQLNFIGDTGVEGGMVSQGTACSLANLLAPISVANLLAPISVVHSFSLFCSYLCIVYGIEARVWSARVIYNICFISPAIACSLDLSRDRFFCKRLMLVRPKP